MSYQVLARKWRPTQFKEVIGQQHVVQALTNAMQTGRLHHAYLFTGTRGVGKTTLGRILAKSLNCEQGPAAEPCGQCSCCKEIDEGRFVDLIEIDAASRTKVEDTREILDNVQYRPSRGRYKVYLIDEVHMLSRHSFNALLKTLEEPPPHVKFLLATTDPQKLPITILSRCLQFNLKAMSLEQIQGQLESILTQENIHYDILALEQLARAAEGSMRDALSLTDQAIAHGQGRLTEAQVTAMLGLIDRDYLKALVQGLLSADANQLMAKVKDIASFAPDYDKLMASLQSLLHRASMSILAPLNNYSLASEQVLLKAIVSHWAPEQIQLAYQILVQGRKDLPYAPDPRSGLEMALLRILLFRPMQATDLPKYEAPTPRDATAPLATAPAVVNTATPAHSQPEPEFASLDEETDRNPKIETPAEPWSDEPEFAGLDEETDRNPKIETQAEPWSDEDEFTGEQSKLQHEQLFIVSQAESQGFQPENRVFNLQSLAPTDAAQIGITTTQQLSAQPVLPVSNGDVAEREQESVPALSLASIAAESPEFHAHEVKAPPPLVSDVSRLEEPQTAPSAPGLLSGVDALLKTRNQLRSQIKALSQQREQSEFSVGATPPSQVEVLTPAPLAQAERQVQVTPTVAPERPMPQATPEQQVDDLPPWQHEPLPDLAAYEADDWPVENEPADTFEYASESGLSDVEPLVEIEPERQELEPSTETSLPTEQDSGNLSSSVSASTDVYLEKKSWWEQLIDTLGFDALKRQLALDCILQPVGDGYQLLVPERTKHLATESNLQELMSRIHGYVGLNTPIELVFQSELVDETPRQAQDRRTEERQQHAVQSIINDPVVKELQQLFDATLDQDTIKPS